MRFIKYLLFFAALVPRGSFGQTVLRFTGDGNTGYIGKDVFYFIDSSKSLSIYDVISRKADFKKSDKDVLNLGVSDNINWLHCSILNETRNDRIVLNVSYPIIYHVSLFVVRNGRPVDSTAIWLSKTISQREYNHQFYIFSIPVSPGELIDCYLKIYGPGQILAPISLGTDKTIIKTVSVFDTLSGVYFGIMIVMLLYNLFVYFSVKDKSYFFYVLYIFWVTLTQATLQGFGQRFIWVDFPWLTRYMITFTGAAVGIATVVFVMSFLQTAKNTPRLHRFLYLIILGDAAAIAVLFFKQFNISYQIVNITAGLGSIFVISVAITLFRKGYRPAKFFLIAWTVFLLSVCFFVMKDFGVIPYNLFSSHSLQFGSAFEAILLSFALADSINVLKKEKEISQAQALRVSQENERIIREQNVMLEAKVNERTVELKQSNSELEKTLYELKETETQLVESEKMASLGQLTAGIAHEINNPINFVTSNVNPLKRDVSILVDMVSQIEELSVAELSVPEKQLKIRQLKSEMDYDYLKTEIDYLLKGIGEGASRTAEIVKGLRVFSRLDEDDLKKADINEGLSSTIVIVNHLLNGTIEVEKNYSGIPLVECYPGKLNQVFLNMMSNAIHALHKRWDGHPGGKLSLSTWNDEVNVFISIKDNGTGMDENTRKKLFEPFFTTKEVGEGTGLGLSIAYNTIKKHNGSIEVLSEPGEGTEFIIGIPINQ